MKVIRALLACCMLHYTCNAHVLTHLSADHYTIQTSSDTNAALQYDLEHGIVYETTANGTKKQYIRTHIARNIPGQSTRIFGTISIANNSEQAGTWYVYQ